MGKFEIHALIPARKGSKGLPGKNTKTMRDKPLVEHTIQVAIDSEQFDTIFVLSDDYAILKIAEDLRVVPFEEPYYLAQDEIESSSLIEYAIKEQELPYRDTLMYLQPSCPLKTAEDIKAAIELYDDSKAGSVVSVVMESDKSPWMFTRKGLFLKHLKPLLNKQMKQQLELIYLLNGAIYYANVMYLIRHSGYFGEDMMPYVMPKERSVNIDDAMDFQLAELLLAQREIEKALKLKPGVGTSEWTS